jgi:hypothetical protein
MMLTVVALLPAMFQVVRPELSFDPVALVLGIAVAVAWLMVLFRSVRARWEGFRLHDGREFGLHAVMGRLLGRHRANL